LEILHSKQLQNFDLQIKLQKVFDIAIHWVNMASSQDDRELAGGGQG
jgi:hypothetical protein